MAAGVAGSRRVTAGSARDHLLGFTAVSGRGEIFVAGGKVVKNVTGYDLPKQKAGSWGRSGEHTSELQSLMRISYLAFSLNENNTEERAGACASYADMIY